MTWRVVQPLDSTDLYHSLRTEGALAILAYSVCRGRPAAAAAAAGACSGVCFERHGVICENEVDVVDEEQRGRIRQGCQVERAEEVTQTDAAVNVPREQLYTALAMRRWLFRTECLCDRACSDRA